MTTALDTISVKYDRSKRTWSVTHGDIVELFAAANDGKQAAIERRLQLARPMLYGMAADLTQSYPALKSRIWKGAQLAAGTGVTLLSSNDATIESSDGRSQYNVYLSASMVYCDCPDQGVDVLVNGRTVTHCKHSIAVMMAAAETAAHAPDNPELA